MTLRPPRRDVVVIGGSAGAVEALGEMLGHLPADLPAAIALVVHRGASLPSRLAQILARRSRLPVVAAEDGQVFARGRVHVAVPDHHLLVTPSGLTLTRGPRQNFARPAIDALFRSAATAYRERVVGVLVSGVGRDGTLGLIAISREGGATLVQDPATAVHRPMLVSAIENDSVDGVFSVAHLVLALRRLAVGDALPDSRTAPASD